MNTHILYILTSALFFFELTAGAVFMKTAGLTGKIARALPFSVFSLMIFQYLFSIIGWMQTGPIVLLILSAFLWLYSIIHSIRVKNNPLDLGFFLFAAVFAILCFCNYGRRVQFADDLNHWAAVVKVMCEQGLLSSSAAANLSHASYPPAMAMLQYIPERLMHLLDGSAIFSEQYLYLAYQAAVATIPFCLVAKLPKAQKWFQKAISATLITLSLFIYSPWIFRFTRIDDYMGLVFGFGAILIVDDDGSRANTFAFSLLCFCLTLFKNTGILISLVLCLCALLIVEKKRMPLYGLVSSAIAYCSWRIMYAIGGASAKFDLTAKSFSSTKLSLLPAISKKYFGAVFSDTVLQGDRILNIPWIAAFLLLLILMIVVLACCKKKKRDTIVCVYMLSINIAVFVFLPLVYSVAFPESEALALDSHQRYLCLSLSGTLLLLIYELCKYAKGCKYLCFFNILLLPLFPYKEPIRFITGHETLQSQQFCKRFDKVNEIVCKNVPITETIEVIIMAQANGNETSMLSYQLLPRPVHFMYENKVGSYRTLFDDNAFPTEADAFAAFLEKNNIHWLLVFTANDSFCEQYGPLFGGAINIQDNTLYSFENGKMIIVQ